MLKIRKADEYAREIGENAEAIDRAAKDMAQAEFSLRQLHKHRAVLWRRFQESISPIMGEGFDLMDIRSSESYQRISQLGRTSRDIPKSIKVDTKNMTLDLGKQKRKI